MDENNSLPLTKSPEIKELKTESYKYHNFQNGNVEKAVNIK